MQESEGHHLQRTEVTQSEIVFPEQGVVMICTSYVWFTFEKTEIEPEVRRKNKNCDIRTASKIR